MAVRHLVHQGPVIGALVRTAAVALTRKAPKQAPVTPGPVLRQTVSPRSASMVDDYVRWAGGSPGAYRGVVPPHLFPQWGFPLIARTLGEIPYDMTKVVNAGCRIEVRRPLPAGEPLQLEACLAAIDDDGRRAILTQRLVTGTASAPEAVVSTMFAYVPSGRRDASGAPRPPKEKPRLPEGAREIGRRRLKPGSGLEFALLTGDFNPVHWIRPYARAAGFKSTILHGFGTLAIAIEALNRVVFSGDPSRLTSIDVKFTRPLVLPREVGVLVDDAGGVFVGDHPGGPAYLIGAFTHG